jgi:outer membrane protein assembly factor BamB
MKPLIPLLLVASLSGCSMLGSLGGSVSSTVGGWFGSSSTAAKPAPLVAFKPSVALQQAWHAEVGEGSLFSPLAEGEVIYAASQDRVLRINLQNGSAVWKTDVRSLKLGSKTRFSAGAGAGAGLVLAGSSTGELVALDAASGNLRWKTPLSSAVSGQLLVVGDRVIARTGDGHVFGLSATDGTRKWLYTRTLPLLSLQGSGGLLVRDGVVYAGFPGGKLVAIKLDNGAQLWEATVALPHGATELERVTDVMGNPVADDTRVCAVAYQGRVACFNLKTGEPLWARDTSSNSGLAMDDRNLYVTDDKDAVTAYDKESGRAGWRQDKLAHRRVSAPLALGTLVVVADAEGYVHLLSADDGGFVGRAEIGSAAASAPVDIGPGFAVQTVKGNVVAFKLK